MTDSNNDSPKNGKPRQFRVPDPQQGASPQSRAAAQQAARSAPQVAPRQSGETSPPSQKQSPQTIPTSAPKKKRKRMWVRVVLLVVAVLGIVLAYFVIQGLLIVNRIDRVELDESLQTPTGDFVNYLLVGSDTREGMEVEGPAGSRADTIIVLRVSNDETLMMSIPRDLWVTIADTGKSGRINGAYNRGPGNLIDTITINLGIPIHHYMEVTFASFSGLVDTLGGVTLHFEHPAYDEKSGLHIEQSGDVTLNGEQALAYVRSRNYVEVINGEHRRDPRADIGRQERQQRFLNTVFSEMGSTRNPLQLMRAGDALSNELVMDSAFGSSDAFQLVRRLSGGNPETVVLPTYNFTQGNAHVLGLVEGEAEAALVRFR